MKIYAAWLDSDAARPVLGALTDAGYAAHFVGGCVRNALLDVPVTDLDVATDARPETVMALAKNHDIKAVPTGIAHGTVTLISDGIPFEVTTYRRDVATDGRRAVVAFADDMVEDARRRDFTINALYADHAGNVVDPLGGLPDLHERRVRFIDDPTLRIQEDYLRILRFFRFTSWYGDPAHGIDADGLAACAEHADGLDGLSAERIGQEMRKLCAAPDPAMVLSSMAMSGILGRVIPGAAPDMIAPLVHIEGLLGLSLDPMRRLAIMGGETERLRLSNADRDARALLRSALPAPELAYRHGLDLGLSKLALDAATMGTPPDSQSLAAVEDAARAVFPISAADLMPRYQGRALGEALKLAEARWIASGFVLGKDDLLA